MQLTSILATGLLCTVGLVNANFRIETTTSIDINIPTTIKNTNDASKWAAQKSSKLASALSTYSTHLTADPKYTSVNSAVYSVLATRTDVEPAVTATGTTTTITTEPPWYTALPSDVRSYYSSVQAAEVSLITAVVNAAPRPTAGYGAAAGFVAAGALGVAAMLV